MRGIELLKAAVAKEVKRKRLQALVAARKRQLAARGEEIKLFDSPFVPSVAGIAKDVFALCDLANAGDDEVILDIGCGDARVLIALVKLMRGSGKHVRCVGIEIDSKLVAKAKAAVASEGLSECVAIHQCDLKSAECRSLLVDNRVTLVFLFLLPSILPTVCRLLADCSSALAFREYIARIRVCSYVFPLRMDSASLHCVDNWPILVSGFTVGQSAVGCPTDRFSQKRTQCRFGKSAHCFEQCQKECCLSSEQSMFKVTSVEPFIKLICNVEAGDLLVIPSAIAGSGNDECYTGEFGGRLLKRRLDSYLCDSRKKKRSLTFVKLQSDSDASVEESKSGDDRGDDIEMVFLKPRAVREIRRKSKAKSSKKVSVSDLFLYSFPFADEDFGWKPTNAAYRFETE